MDDAHFFLGMKMERDRECRKLWLSQESYAGKLIRRFKVVGGTSNIPMRNDIKLQRANSDEIEDAKGLPYRELVGSLMYLACTTRPDIMFSVSCLARYVAFYGLQHWNEAKRVAKYVSKTRNISLCYGNGTMEIIGFSDADWAGDYETRKSTSGFVYNICGASFIWKSKLQTIVAGSSVESEYIALSKCVREGLWVRKLLHDFGLKSRAINILCANQGAITLSEHGKMSAATKHTATCYHLVRDYAEKKLFSISYVPSMDMVADGMTKPLARKKLAENSSMMGLRTKYN